MKQDFDLTKLLNTKEMLRKELKLYLTQHGTLGQVLQHPLVFQVPYFDQLAALSNKQFEYKTQYVNEAIKAKEWHQVVWFYERPYRLQAFETVVDHLDDKEYWEILSNIWIDSENIWQNFASWQRRLSSSRAGSLMDEQEKEFFDKLPKRFTIYRGYTKGKNRDGLSYTLEPERAGWFARRYDRNSGKTAVRKRVVNKEDVLAYIAGRNEKEIIIRPDKA